MEDAANRILLEGLPRSDASPEREAELVEAVAREFEKRGPSVTQHTYWMIDLAKAAIDTLRAMGALADDEPKRPAEKEAAPTSKPE